MTLVRALKPVVLSPLMSLQARRCRLPALALGAALLAGCGSPPLQMHDYGTSIAMARATVRPGGAAGGAGLELEVSRVRGSAFQQRNEFDDFSIGGPVPEQGPALLRHDARNQTLQLAYHHRLFAGRPLEMAWFVGAAAGRLDWTTTEQGGTGRQGSTRVNWVGPTGGVSLRWNMAPQWFGEFRYAGTLVNSSDDFGTRGHLELALAWQPASALQLRVGVAQAGITLWPNGNWSELSFVTRGPFAAVVLGY